MNYGSEPADQVVRYSLEGAEFALRISGTAAKNFFIFAQAVLHDSKKTHGKTHLIRLLKEQKPLKFFTVDKDRMHDFARAAKAHDPDFYLKHNFEKADSTHGCPYVQANCDLQTPSGNILVYGHNMKDGTMFSDLLQEKNRVIGRSVAGFGDDSSPFW